MIAPCAAHIPLPNIPARVVVIRGGRRLHNEPAPSGSPTAPSPPAPGPFLQAGDEIRVGRSATLHFVLSGNGFRVTNGRVRLGCQSVAVGSRSRTTRTTVLAVGLQSGRVQVSAGEHPRRALVLSPEMLAYATEPRTTLVVGRNPAARTTRAWTLDRPIVAASASRQWLRINARAGYTAISDRDGLRLDIWPFAISPLQRATTGADRLPPYWADGSRCSVGCAAPGVEPGWPLLPFHRQHAIRAGINELRPANFHVGVDIQADNFQRVYAIQSGRASVSPTGSFGDWKVTVGSFTYWHISPTVSDGQRVIAYTTELGRVLNGFGHIAFSETNAFLNPLRPGGPLRPYTDTEPPIIGVPRVFADGRVSVAAFDPQSFVHRQSYETPVLAPSSLAWRLYDARGRALTGLVWAMRGSHHYATNLKPLIFAPGASNPGFECFYTRVRCIPNWVYWLAGGLTRPLPLAILPRGRYRLAIYAWDWAGNTSALDYWINLPLARAAGAAAEFGPLAPNID